MPKLVTNFKRIVGPKGQVVIPKDVREHLGIKPGSEVIFEVQQQGATLKPGKSPSELVDECLSILSPKLKHKVEIDQIIEEETREVSLDR